MNILPFGSRTVRPPAHTELLKLLDVLEEAPAKTGQERHAESGDIGNPDIHDVHTQQVRQELHDETIGGNPAVHAELPQPNAAVLFHDGHHIPDLIGDRFECGPGKMAFVRAEGQAEDRRPQVHPPVRCPQAAERRDEIHTAVVLDRESHFLRLGAVGEQTQLVAEPHDRGATSDDDPFQGIVHPARYTPADRRHGSLGRLDALRARVQQNRATGAQRRLGGPGREAAFAKRGGMGIADHRRDRDRFGQKAAEIGPAIVTGRWSCLRQLQILQAKLLEHWPPRTCSSPGPGVCGLPGPGPGPPRWPRHKR